MNSELRNTRSVFSTRLFCLPVVLQHRSLGDSIVPVIPFASLVTFFGAGKPESLQAKYVYILNTKFR